MKVPIDMYTPISTRILKEGCSTGREDIDSRTIHEGDIIIVVDDGYGNIVNDANPEVVQWDEEHAGFVRRQPGFKKFGLTSSNRWRVVGSWHDNVNEYEKIWSTLENG